MSATPINQQRLVALTQAAIQSLHALLREIGADPGGYHHVPDEREKEEPQFHTAPGERSGPRCPKCRGAMKPRQSARGPFFGCAAYPQCDGTRPGEKSRSADPRSIYAQGNSESEEWEAGRQ